MSDFKTKFQRIAGAFHGAVESIQGKIDRFTFKSLVDCLKSEDAEAVITAITQLEHEKRTVAVPPLYFVSREHPSRVVRARAEAAIAKIANKARIDELTSGKSTEDSVKALIEEYGHYRS